MVSKLIARAAALHNIRIYIKSTTVQNEEHRLAGMQEQHNLGMCRRFSLSYGIEQHTTPNFHSHFDVI